MDYASDRSGRITRYPEFWRQKAPTQKQVPLT